MLVRENRKPLLIAGTDIFAMLSYFYRDNANYIYAGECICKILTVAGNKY